MTKMTTDEKLVAQLVDDQLSKWIRQAFHADVKDPKHYDLIVNTSKVTVPAAVRAICGAWEGQAGKG